MNHQLTQDSLEFGTVHYGTYEQRTKNNNILISFILF